MLKKLFAFAAVLTLSLSLHAQTNLLPHAILPVSTNASAVSGAEPIVLNPDGSVSISPDVLNFLPPKYKTLIILLCAPPCRFAS